MSRPAALARAEAKLEQWVGGTQLAGGRYPVHASAKMDVKQAVMAFLRDTPMSQWPAQLPVHLADSRVSSDAMQKVLPDLGLPVKLVVAGEMQLQVEAERERASFQDAQYEGWILPEPDSPLARASDPIRRWEEGMGHMGMCIGQLDPSSGPQDAESVKRTFIFVTVATERLASALVRMECDDDAKVALLMEIDDALTQVGSVSPQLAPQLERLRGSVLRPIANDLEPQNPGSVRSLEQFRGRV